MKNTIFVCPTYVDCDKPAFAQELERVVGIQVLYCDVSHFADGETTVDFPDKECVKGKEVILIRHFTFGFKYSLNHQLFNFLLIASILKQCGAKKVTTLMPYVPYARHDVSPFCDGSMSF